MLDLVTQRAQILTQRKANEIHANLHDMFVLEHKEGGEGDNPELIRRRYLQTISFLRSLNSHATEFREELTKDCPHASLELVEHCIKQLRDSFLMAIDVLVNRAGTEETRKLWKEEYLEESAPILHIMLSTNEGASALTSSVSKIQPVASRKSSIGKPMLEKASPYDRLTFPEKRSFVLESLRTAFAHLQEQAQHFFLHSPVQPHAHQLRKIRAVLEGLADRGHKKDIITDITPTRGGKTLKDFLIAKLLQEGGRTPVLYLSYSNPILLGQKGAYYEASRIFPEHELGVVNADKKEFGRLVTFASFHMAKQAGFANEFIQSCGKNLPLIILDEGDLFQTDLSLEFLEKIKKHFHCPFIIASSATEEVNNRNLGKMSHVVDRMTVSELILLGLAKHVMGFYVAVDLDITADKLVNTAYGKELNYAALNQLEKEALIVHPIDLYFQHMAGEPSLFITSRVDHAREIAKRLCEKGVKAVCMSGDPDQYEAVIAAYLSGEITVITGADVIGRGITLGGHTKNVVYCNAVTSATRLYQGVARGLDSDPDIDYLRIWQYIPKIKAPNCPIALLEDVFPGGLADTHVPHFKDTHEAETWIRKEAKKQGKIGMIGVPMQADESVVRLFTATQTRESLNTEALSDKMRCIKGGFQEIMNTFMGIAGIDSIEKINTALPHESTRVNIPFQNKEQSFTWKNFVANVLMLTVNVNYRYALAHPALAIRIAKIWYKEGVMPERQRVLDMIEESEKDPNIAIISRHFYSFMQDFRKLSDSQRPLSITNPQSNTEVTLQHNGEKFTYKWKRFLQYALAAAAGVDPRETLAQSANAIKVITEWERTKMIPRGLAVSLIANHKDRFQSLSEAEQKTLIKGHFMGICHAFLRAHNLQKLGDLENTMEIRYPFEGNDIRMTWGECKYAAAVAINSRYSKQVLHRDFRTFVDDMVTLWFSSGKIPDAGVMDDYASTLYEKREDDAWIQEQFPSCCLAWFQEFQNVSTQQGIPLGTLNKSKKLSIPVSIGDSQRSMIFRSFLISVITHVMPGITRNKADDNKALALSFIENWAKAGEILDINNMRKIFQEEERKKLIQKRLPHSEVVSATFSQVYPKILAGEKNLTLRYLDVDFEMSERTFLIAMMENFFDIPKEKSRPLIFETGFARDLANLWFQSKKKPSLDQIKTLIRQKKKEHWLQYLKTGVTEEAVIPEDLVFLPVNDAPAEPIVDDKGAVGDSVGNVDAGLRSGLETAIAKEVAAEMGASAQDRTHEIPKTPNILSFSEVSGILQEYLEIAALIPRGIVSLFRSKSGYDDIGIQKIHGKREAEIVYIRKGQPVGVVNKKDFQKVLTIGRYFQIPNQEIYQSHYYFYDTLQREREKRKTLRSTAHVAHASGETSVSHSWKAPLLPEKVITGDRAKEFLEECRNVARNFPYGDGIIILLRGSDRTPPDIGIQKNATKVSLVAISRDKGLPNHMTAEQVLQLLDHNAYRFLTKEEVPASLMNMWESWFSEKK